MADFLNFLVNAHNVFATVLYLALLWVFFLVRHWFDSDKKLSGGTALMTFLGSVWLLSRYKNHQVLQDGLILFSFGSFFYFLKAYIAHCVAERRAKKRKRQQKERHQKKIDWFKKLKHHR